MSGNAGVMVAQRLAVRGYAKAGASQHRMLRIADPARARRAIGVLLDRGAISFGPVDSSGSGLDIGFTCRGLRRLGLPALWLQAFEQCAPAFVMGATARASRRLGDVGPSAPANWEPAFGVERADVLVCMHGVSLEAVQQRADDLAADPDIDVTAAFDGWGEPIKAQHLPGPTDAPAKARFVHFGYRDDVTRPTICSPPREGARLHKSGELLLGHANDLDFDPWYGQPRAVVEFVRGGSFGVLRLIAQWPAGFEAYVTELSQRLSDAEGWPVTPEYLKAKLCGRWTNGVLVDARRRVAPPPAPPSLPAGFDKYDDTDGTGCPFGSHIRRTNPRNDRLISKRQRPLFRRGMPYGPPFERSRPDDGVPRGLVGLFFCASIEDQFEHVMSEWVEKMPMGPLSTGRAKDPLVGQHADPAAEFHIPLINSPPVPPMVIRDLRSFTHTRGTLYAMFPSRPALLQLASWR